MNKEEVIKPDEKTKEMAESYLKRANNEYDEAKEHLEKRHYSESISASQECIELSIKAIFLLLQGEYPRSHEFKEEEFEAILKRIPEKLKYLDFHKLYLYSKFWSSFRTIAKYGLEKLGIGAEKLFEEEEAELALKHADKCKFAANELKNYMEHPW
jgi:HEPN domain-containing protein